MRASETAPLLRIRDATVRKGGRAGAELLAHLSLEIPQGQHTAILGPNGSGKSTLIKLIAQEYRPLANSESEPRVEIFGRDRWNVFELRSLLGIVSPDLQHYFTDPSALTVTGLDVVLSGFFATRVVPSRQDVSASLRDRAREALALLDSSHLEGKPIGEMSTGEARRVLIARALVSDPRALLLDEPTAGLDVVARHRFLETVRSLAQMGKTIIFVTHQLQEVIPEVERVVLLKQGRVYRDGCKREVLTPEVLSAVFGAAVHVESTTEGYYHMHIAPT